MGKARQNGKMADVAKWLGVEIGEEFCVEGCNREFVLYQTGLYAWEIPEPAMLVRLLAGKEKIKKKPWKAHDGELVYYPSFGVEHFHVDSKYNIASSEHDGNLYEYGMMCRTKEQAEEIGRAMIATARKMQGFDH